MIATRFKDDTNALNATHVTDPNQIVEIIQKSLCWNVLQGGREFMRGSDVAFAEKSLNHPRSGRLSLVCTLDHVAARFTNGKNCSVANSEPFFARFVRLKLPTLKGCDVFLSYTHGYIVL